MKRLLKKICHLFSRKAYSSINKKFDPCVDSSNPEFLLWAFGEKYWLLSNIEKMTFWNKRHGEALIINTNDCISESIYKMGALWIKSLNTIASAHEMND